MPKRKRRKLVNRKKAKVYAISAREMQEFYADFETAIEPKIRAIDRRRLRALARARSIPVG